MWLYKVLNAEISYIMCLEPGLRWFVLLGDEDIDVCKDIYVLRNLSPQKSDMCFRLLGEEDVYICKESYMSSGTHLLRNKTCVSYC